MNTKFFTFALAAAMFLLFSCNGNGQNEKTATTESETSAIQVIQFHSEHRCMTCNLIEKLTKEALQNLPEVIFKTVNVDDPKNEKIAAEFEATGTALFIYNPKTGKKKELTDFAFMNAKSKPEEFKKGIIDAIRNF